MSDTDGDGLFDGEEVDGKKPICFEKDSKLLERTISLKGYASYALWTNQNDVP